MYASTQFSACVCVLHCRSKVLWILWELSLWGFIQGLIAFKNQFITSAFTGRLPELLSGNKNEEGGGEGKSWIKMENGYRWLIVNVKGEKWRYNTKGEKEKGQPRARESNKEMSTCIHCMYEQTFKIPLHFLYFTALVWQPEVSDFKCFYCLGQWIQVLHCAFGCSGLWNLIMIDLYIENFSVLFPLSLTLLLCFLFSSLYPF